MLTKNGNTAKARTRAIQAIVAEPYNAKAWRGLQQWAAANKVQVNTVRINTHSTVNSDGGVNINITLDPKGPGQTGMAWIIYAGSRARWRQGEFQKRFPDEKVYRHSLPEESEALSAMAGTLQGKKEKAISADPDLSLLQKIADAKLIEAYVLLGVPDQGIAHDYAAYRAQNRAKLEQYLGQFVVPEISAKH